MTATHTSTILLISPSSPPSSLQIPLPQPAVASSLACHLLCPSHPSGCTHILIVTTVLRTMGTALPNPNIRSQYPHIPTVTRSVTSKYPKYRHCVPKCQKCQLHWHRTNKTYLATRKQRESTFYTSLFTWLAPEQPPNRCTTVSYIKEFNTNQARCK